MKRRILGRLLLLSVFVTGLAGRIKDDSITAKERKAAVSLMQDTRDAAIDATKNLSEAQLNFRTEPGRWSVTECMYHIAASEKMLWGMFEKAMQGPATPEKRAEVKVTDDQVVQMVEDRSVKRQTTDNLKPENSGYQVLEEAVNDFRKTRGAHIDYMKTTTEDLRNHFVTTPGGTMDCYQFYLFIAAHSNRHTQQMEEVKSNPAFPSE